MKKQFTFIGAFLFATSLSMAQSNIVLPEFSMKKNTEAISESSNKVGRATRAKAGGDVIFSSDFSDTLLWTKEQLGEQGQWRFGQLPNNVTQYYDADEFTTKANGYAFFNAVQYLISGPVDLQNAAIVSVDIPVSDIPVVGVNFEQTFRNFNYSKTFVEVSFDGGTSWISKQINLMVPVNTYNSEEEIFQTVYFNNSGNAANMKLRFRWESLSTDDDYGSGYGWAIDDVEVFEGYSHNVKLDIAYTTMGDEQLSYTKIPAFQAPGLGNVGFGAKVSSTGYEATEAKLKATSGTYTFTSAATEIAAFGSDSLGIDVANGLTLPVTVGNSDVTLTIIDEVNELTDTADDSKIVKLEITEEIFATDTYDGTPGSMQGSFGGWSGANGDPGIGTLYEITAPAALKAARVGIAPFGTASQAQFLGNAFQVTLYKFNGEAWEYFFETSYHNITSADFGNLVELSFGGTALTIEPGIYLPIAKFLSDARVPVAFAGYSSAGTTIGVAGDDFVRLASDAATPGIVETPIVRLVVSQNISAEKVTAEDLSVSVFPNPVADKATVSFTLASENQVAISVTDLTGREVMTVDAANFGAGTHTIEVDSAKLTAGVYNYTITAGNSVITKKVVKK